MRWFNLVVVVIAGLCGCATPASVKLIDIKDAKRAAWADPRQTFQPTETPLVHIRGYGGRKVTIELWRDPDVLFHKAVHDIPARKTYRTYDGLVFDTRFKSEIVVAEKETFYWTSTDYLLRFKPLPPGVYELRLSTEDGRKQSAKFTVAAFP